MKIGHENLIEVQFSQASTKNAKKEKMISTRIRYAKAISNYFKWRLSSEGTVETCFKF